MLQDKSQNPFSSQNENKKMDIHYGCMSDEKSLIDKDDTPLPFWFILIAPVMIIIVLGLFLFPISKWAWNWLEAWIVIISMGIITFIGYTIINQKNPRVIRNRYKN